MQDEETDLSLADFKTPSSPKRPETALLLNDGPDNENAPDLTGRGRLENLEHETGLELLGSFASSPPRWQRVPAP
jgi:hypothetical protein